MESKAQAVDGSSSALFYNNTAQERAADDFLIK